MQTSGDSMRAMSDEPLGGGSRSPLTPYQLRRFSFSGVEPVGELQIKVYCIATGDSLIDSATMSAAVAHIQDHLPGLAEREGDHHNLGFAILHQGQSATWLLMHWWAHADILCQRMAHTDESGGFVGTDRPFHGCVWEGVIIAHEHRAWVESMLTETPDPRRYVDTVLSDGEY